MSTKRWAFCLHEVGRGQACVAKAESGADDDVVFEGDSQDERGSGKGLGCFEIGPGRRWIAAGVIMSNDDAGRAEFQGSSEDGTRVDHAGVDRADVSGSYSDRN